MSIRKRIAGSGEILLVSVDTFDAINHISEICSTIYFPGCNLECPFCFNDDLVNRRGLSELSLEQIEYLLFEKNNKTLKHIVLTGGEALIHPNFIDIVNMLNQNPVCSIQVNTNMMNPEELKWFLEHTKNPMVAFDYKTTKKDYKLLTRNAIDVKKRFDSSLSILCTYAQLHEDITIQARSTITEFLFLKKNTIEIIAKDLYKNFKNIKNFTWRLQDLEPLQFMKDKEVDVLIQDKLKPIVKHIPIIYHMVES